MKSDLFSYLEDITFAEKDPAIIERDIIALYEDETNRTLARGDPVRLFINAIILALIQQRNVIDISAKNNLLAYASGSYLDHIGALLGVTRLEPSHASCTVTFTLSASLTFDVVIPVGTRVTTGDGVIFATTEAVTIPAGESQCSVIVTCTESGIKGNGYVPGQIRRLVDVFPYELSVMNSTESSGGSDTESDENYRERIQIAPESFSSAGPVGAYEYYARSAHPDIIDVSVMGPPDTEPGHVEIYPLMTGGVIPSDEIIASVYETCNAEDVRPDTDYVHVLKPETVSYDLSIKFWIDEANSSRMTAIIASVEGAVDSWVQWERSRLGRDINPSELNHRVIAAGAKRCEIVSPGFVRLRKNQLAVMNGRSVICEGLEES